MDNRQVERAAAVLRAGGLVAFPTETVYGLGADAANPIAVRRIFAVKGRPAGHPLIVHVASHAALENWVREIPPAARRLAEHFWPGPLTLILQRADHVLSEVTGGQGTVGLRVPSHPMAQDLLRAFGGGVAAPSANRFGRISPTTAEHVRDELGGDVDLILDGGPCEVGIESTIVDLSTAIPVLLRPGRISAEAIEGVVGAPVRFGGAGSPRAPGTLAAHYAPRLPLVLVPSTALETVVKDQGKRLRLAVLARQPMPAAPWPATEWRQAPADPLGYAHDVYATLRALDRSDFDKIIVESPPPSPEWAAVRDRLERAAAGSGTESPDFP